MANDNVKRTTDALFAPIRHTDEFREFITHPPTLERAIEFLRRKYGSRTSEDEIRTWYDEMECTCWTDRQGHAIRNWAYMFYCWRNSRRRFASTDAAREAEAAARREDAERRLRGERRKPRADNYIRADEEQLQRFRDMFI